jgi:hypothetical protein
LYMDGFVAPFWALFGVIAVFMAYRLFRYGGPRGAIYGGRVVRTVDTVPCESRGIVSAHIAVNLIEMGEEGKVGLGVTHKSLVGFQWVPVRLNSSQAEALARALSYAAIAARQVKQGGPVP